MSVETMPSQQHSAEELAFLEQQNMLEQAGTEDESVTSSERSKPRLLSRAMYSVQRYLENQAKSAGSAAENIESHRTLGEVASDSWDSTKEFAQEQYDEAKDKLISAGQKTWEATKSGANTFADKATEGLNKMGEKTNDFVGSAQEKFTTSKERLVGYFIDKKNAAIERKNARVAARQERREERANQKEARREERAERAKAENIERLENQATAMQDQLNKLMEELRSLKSTS